MGFAFRAKKAEVAAVSVAKASPRTERFERYIERFRGPIYTYVMRLVKDDGAAEDIAQETFVRLYRELDGIRDNTASAWLYRVARNLVTDYVRKKRPVTFTVLKGQAADDDEDGGPLQFAQKGVGPAGEALNHELQSMIAQTLDAMSPKFRDVLELVDIQGLTHDEAGNVLGCSAKTVSARLSRAREFFTHRLARHVDLRPPKSRGGAA
jgi:RNA polymerase sigma-70 factor (ECF subfamily)